MAFIGNTVQTQGFTPAVDYFSGNGSTVTFTLSRPVASVAQMIVAIDNVIQNPSSSFTVSGSAITFSSAPLAGTNNIWVEYTSLITTYAAISQSPSVIGDITASGGYLASGSFNNSFLDGTIVDYVTGNGRITVGSADGFTIYTGGTSARSALASWTQTGALTLPVDASISGLTVGKGGGAVSTNTAVGASALTTNSTGAYNTVLGYNAGYDSSTAQYNTYVGANCATQTNTGSNNSALGYQALRSNTTASNNTAVGYQAGYSSTTGNDNTFVGWYAGRGITTGTYNTFIGDGAGNAITTGGKNVILGTYNGNFGGLDIRTASNYIVLSDGDGNPRNYIDSSGYNYLLGSGGGRIYFRDTSNTAQYSIQSTSGTFYIFSAANYAFLSGTGFSSWSFASDARIKENIVDLDYGLNSIMALKPRRFDYISNKQNDIGFIAQEIQSVIPEAVTGKEIEFSENDTQQERAEKTMGVSKDLLIPVLVKAIQELKAEVDALKAGK